MKVVIIFIAANFSMWKKAYNFSFSYFPSNFGFSFLDLELDFRVDHLYWCRGCLGISVTKSSSSAGTISLTPYLSND